MQTPKWPRCRNYQIFKNTFYSEDSCSKGEHSQNERKEIEGMPKNQVETFFNFFFFFFCLCWVFVSVQGLSLDVESGGYSSSRCAGLSLSRSLLLQSTGSRRAGSVVVAHGPSCSTACGIFPDRGSNPCPLHWQADSQPLHHQGSPQVETFELIDTITELESPLEHLKSRIEMRKRRTNELEGWSIKIIQSGKHRRKKKCLIKNERILK